jgi:DNA-binding transcriptional regulator YiaG
METIDVQELRKTRAKMDRQAFAKLIGVSTAQLASVEIGRRNLSLSAVKIVRLLNSKLVTKEQLEAL